MVNVLKSINTLNLFMNSKLTEPQRMLAKFQKAAVIDVFDNTDSSDALEDYYNIQE